jgi:hypothetical protein
MPAFEFLQSPNVIGRGLWAPPAFDAEPLATHGDPNDRSAITMTNVAFTVRPLAARAERCPVIYSPLFRFQRVYAGDRDQSSLLDT